MESHIYKMSDQDFEDFKDVIMIDSELAERDISSLAIILMDSALELSPKDIRHFTLRAIAELMSDDHLRAYKEPSKNPELLTESIDESLQVIVEHWDKNESNPHMIDFSACFYPTAKGKARIAEMEKHAWDVPDKFKR